MQYLCVCVWVFSYVCRFSSWQHFTLFILCIRFWWKCAHRTRECSSQCVSWVKSWHFKSSECESERSEKRDGEEEKQFHISKYIFQSEKKRNRISLNGSDNGKCNTILKQWHFLIQHFYLFCDVPFQNAMRYLWFTIASLSLSLYVEDKLYATCIMCPYKNERSCQWQATPHSESNKNATHFTFLLDLLRFYALNTFLVAKQIKNYNERVIIAFLYIFQRSCEAKKAAKMLQYSIELL